MPRLPLALCFTALALLNACSDSTSGPASPSDHLRPAGNVTLTSCSELPPEGVVDLINQVFGVGSVDANSAIGKWQNIQKQIADGNIEGARDKTWSLVEFMVAKQQLDKLPVSAAFSNLVRSLFCAVGIEAGMPLASNVWILDPSNSERILITSDGNAGVKIPGGAVNEKSIVTISASSDTLNTMLDKYDVQVGNTRAPTYQFSKYPSNKFQLDVVVSVCAVAEETMLDNLVLGHNVGASGFEILPEEVSFLSCTLQAARTSSPSLLDRVVAFVLPTIAYAAGPGASGIGGSVPEFSPIGPVDPTIKVTKNAAGTSAPIGSPLSPAPSVTLATPNGTALENIPVAFAVVSGGGSITPSSVNTLATGVAATAWRMGLTPGSNSASATPAIPAAEAGSSPAVTGVVFSPASVTFTATATPPSAIVYSGGPSGSYTAGTTLPTIVATVVDAGGRTVEGFTGNVNIAATPGPIASGTNPRTAVAGVASFNDIVINKSGSHTLTVSTTYGANLLSATGGSFVITTGTATSLAINGGNNQTAPAGSVLGVAPLIAPSVVAKDNFGNVVSGVPVYWLPGGVSGVITPASPTTNTSGIASATWALLPGVNEMIASLDPTLGAEGRFQTFNATGTTSTAALVSCGPGNNRDAISNYLARMDGTNRNITDTRFFFSVTGAANEPTPYTMVATARVRSNGSGAITTFTSLPTTVFLRGNNAEQKEANFKFQTPIVSGGGTKITFEVVKTAPVSTSGTINFNVGDCPPGTKCNVRPACPVVEVAPTDPFTSTPYRLSFGIRVFGN